VNLVLVGIGGVVGSLTRFQLGKFIAQRTKTTLPVGTFIINITGAVLLGLMNSLNVNVTLSLLLADGFLGAYTTFSTFMYEGFNLFQENEKMNAFTYIIGSVFIGVVGYVIGFEAGKLLL
jgi:CrcB protein